MTGEWISVEERLPETTGEVLTFRDFGKGYGGIRIYCFRKETEQFYYWHNSIDGFVPTIGITHWMPLPEPPTETKLI